MKDLNDEFKLFQGKLGNGVIDYSFVCSNGENFIDIVSIDEDVYGIVNLLSGLRWWNFVKRYKLLKLLKNVYKGITTSVLSHYDFDRLIYKLGDFVIKVNPVNKVVVLNGMKYSMVLFNDMRTFPIGVPFTFVERKDGVVTLEKQVEVVSNN